MKNSAVGERQSLLVYGKNNLCAGSARESKYFNPLVFKYLSRLTKAFVVFLEAQIFDDQTC